ncbi:pyridoxal phosphate-dependent transferase, partial [Obelidium mucronatum]
MRLSTRAHANLTRPSILAEGAAAAAANPFSETSNPDGIVNLGRAENKLMDQEVLDMLPVTLKAEHLPYGLYHGSKLLRENIARLFNTRLALDRPLTSDQVAVGNGATPLVSCAAMIVADYGDAILLPTPVYGSFGRDIEAAAGVSVVLARATGSNEYPTLQELDQAFQSHPKVKAILITNPGNPSGRIMPLETLVSWLKWAESKKIHVIVDEVYMFSVWNESATFVSALTFHEDIIDSSRLHTIWSFSKDFCMNGMRAAALTSRNADFIRAYKELAYFHAIPRVVDAGLAHFLQDLERVDAFIRTNHARLRAAFAYVLAQLDARRVAYRAPQAGICVWLSATSAQKEKEKKEKNDAEKDDAELFRALLRGGVYAAPGAAFFCDKPGMLRVIVSLPQNTLEVGVRRLLKV